MTRKRAVRTDLMTEATPYRVLSSADGSLRILHDFMGENTPETRDLATHLEAFLNSPGLTPAKAQASRAAKADGATEDA